jgi:hypothetical protein
MLATLSGKGERVFGASGAFAPQFVIPGRA